MRKRKYQPLIGEPFPDEAPEREHNHLCPKCGIDGQVWEILNAAEFDGDSIIEEWVWTCEKCDHDWVCSE